MAVHALTPLMRGNQQASAYDVFDRSVSIAEQLIAKVDATAAADPDGPDRDELMDMGIHALSALLNGRPSADVDALLDECMAQAKALIARVDDALGEGATDSDREELMDVAVHVQTAVLSTRPKADPAAVSDQCVEVGEKLVVRVDEALAPGH